MVSFHRQAEPVY